MPVGLEYSCRDSPPHSFALSSIIIPRETVLLNQTTWALFLELIVSVGHSTEQSFGGTHPPFEYPVKTLHALLTRQTVPNVSFDPGVRR